MQRLQKNFWKKYFEVYDLLNNSYPYRELLNNIIELLNVQLHFKILDVGAGTGNLLTKLPVNTTKYAIDFSEEALEIAKKKNYETKCQISDITLGLPYEDDFFNGVVLNNVLYNFQLDEVEKIIKESIRVLGKKGVIIISNPKENAKISLIAYSHFKKVFTQSFFKGFFYTFIYLLQFLKLIYYNKIILKKNNSLISTPPKSFFLKILNENDMNVTYVNEFAYAGQNILIKAEK